MSLGSRLVGLDGVDLGRRAGLIAAGGIVVLVLVTVTVVFLGLSAHAVLAERFTPAQAALIVAAVAAVLAGVVAGVTMAAIGRARRSVTGAVRASTIAALAPPALSLAFRHVGITAVVAVAAAYLATRRR